MRTHRLARALCSELDLLKNNILKKKASCLIIDGLMGSGKTTLSVVCAEYFQDGEYIDYASQYAIGGKDFIKKINVCRRKKRVVVIYDEAGDYNKYGSLTKFNKVLNGVFQKFRTYQILVIMVLPKFEILPNFLFEQGVPKVLFHVERDVDAKDGEGENFAEVSTYSLSAMFRMLYLLKKSKLDNPFAIYRKVKPEASGIRFYDLPKERSEELDRISTAQKGDSLLEAEIDISSLSVGLEDVNADLRL